MSNWHTDPEEDRDLVERGFWHQVKMFCAALALSAIAIGLGFLL